MILGFLNGKERIEELEAENKYLKEELERIKGTSDKHICGFYCIGCKNLITDVSRETFSILYHCRRDYNCKDFERE